MVVFPIMAACSDLEELLRRLQREGYEIKRGKYISARAPDQERFTRLKTLGVDYTEEALAARIAGRSRPSRQPKQRNGKISLLIDIQNNIKAQQTFVFAQLAVKTVHIAVIVRDEPFLIGLAEVILALFR